MKAADKVFPYRLMSVNGQGTVFTARDYIAIQAMVGLSANQGFTLRSYDDIADIAYKQADAMIKRSEVKDE